MLRDCIKALKTQFKGILVKIINILVIAFYSAYITILIPNYTATSMDNF